MVSVIFIFPIFAQCIATAYGFSSDGCGTQKSCWFQPPQCETEQIENCDSSVKWTVLEDGVLFELEATIVDLNPTAGHYLALGISKDTRMGDDSVVECVFRADGVGKAYISFNDETHNAQLHQATAVMLNETSLVTANDSIECIVKWQFDGRDNVNQRDQFKVFELESRPWYLLFARGNVDIYSGQKKIHSVNDGRLFPWISKQKVEFCRNNCSSDQHIVVSEMKQTDLSRYWRYRFAVMHGSFLLLAWWILGSSALILARYFKPLRPRRKLLGTAVWFQDWYKKMHVITGIGATGFALIQPFLALGRPGPNSKYRFIFNWVHWFLGMLAWTLASVTIILSVPLSKTGLMSRYGHAPTWIMAGYMITFFLCCIVLEILSSASSRRTEKHASYRFVAGPTGMALSVINGPSTESPVATPTYAIARIFIFIVHLIIALGVSITITVMLVKILLSHSP